MTHADRGSGPCPCSDPTLPYIAPDGRQHWPEGHDQETRPMTTTKPAKAPRPGNITHGRPDASVPEHLPGLADVCPDCRNISRLFVALRDFGYTTLVLPDVRAAYEIATTRPLEPTDDVIARLVRSQLAEAGMPLP